MNRPTKEEIRLILQTAIANAKAAYAMLERHDNVRRDEMEGCEPYDALATGSYYQNEERLSGAVSGMEAVLDRVKECIEKGSR